MCCHVLSRIEVKWLYYSAVGLVYLVDLDNSCIIVTIYEWFPSLFWQAGLYLRSQNHFCAGCSPHQSPISINLGLSDWYNFNFSFYGISRLWKQDHGDQMVPFLPSFALSCVINSAHHFTVVTFHPIKTRSHPGFDTLSSLQLRKPSFVKPS